MNKLIILINKSITILLIFFIILMTLNQYYVIYLSSSLRLILYFLTAVLIVVSSTKDIIINKTPLLKFISTVILLGFIVGVSLFFTQWTLNLLIYASIIGALVKGFLDLVFQKA